MKNSTLSKKILHNTIMPVFLSIAFISIIWFFHIVDDYNKNITELRQNHLSEQKNIVGNSVRLLVDLISQKEYFEKEDIIKFVSKLRYGKNSYFWISDLKSTIIMHPTLASLDGQDISTYADPNGRFAFNEMVKRCREEGEGFVQYRWPKPDDGIVKDKISFVKSIDELGWIIGSGIYLDEIEKSIAIKKDILKENIKKLVFISILLGLILLFIIYIVINKFYKEIKVSFDEFYKFSNNSFTVANILNENQFEYAEFKLLAKSINRMVNQRLKFEKEITEFNENLEELVRERTIKLEENIKTLKEAQSQLIQSEKMASLGNLVAGVAHEINTPVGIALTGITHAQDELNVLDRSYKRKSMSETDFLSFLEDTHEINTSIIKNLNRAANLVKSFKQVAVDQSSDELREFNLNAYIEEILASLSNKIKKTKHVIRIDIDKDINLKSYPGAFSQIFTNFIMNSLIHAYKDSEAGTIRITANLKEEILIITYADDGKGLDTVSKEKIFDPFYTTNRNYGGSGLGMNIVYNIVTKKLNGTIELGKKDSKGILFIIKIKINKI